MIATDTEQVELERLIPAYLPEGYPLSDFYIDKILASKGDLSVPTKTKKQPKNGKDSVIDEKFSRAEKRTEDFVPRARRIPYSFGSREIYHTRRRDRVYVKRNTPRKAGTRSHIRNFRPEIPNLALNKGSSSLLTLESILNYGEEFGLTPFLANENLYVSVADGEFRGTYRIGLLKYVEVLTDDEFAPQPYSKLQLADLLVQNNLPAKLFYDDGKLNIKLGSGWEQREFWLYISENPAFVDPKSLLPLINSPHQLNLQYCDNGDITPKYTRKHSNEESQTRPKIPFREIKALRKRSHTRGRAHYMLVNAPPTCRHEEYGVINPSPIREHQRDTTTWSYTPLVKLPHI